MASEAPSSNGGNGSGSKRKPALLAVTALVAVGAIGYGVYWALVLRHHESTDNAYVQAPMVQITPQVAGTVLAVLVDDTDVVKVGQPLVRLDPADARLALERAESQLAQTVRYPLPVEPTTSLKEIWPGGQSLVELVTPPERRCIQLMSSACSRR